MFFIYSADSKNKVFGKLYQNIQKMIQNTSNTNYF